ncbi:uncharacterized protein LOC125028131 [Penaeus chinensis]|uniref:uncharacterized protein LOC125028131 n=1 Tax=Penaeus chinensis TaxID=139456 RepID=UPI001FB73DA8|nr:uncharacterized protein LOC125028131 [Penaeus chinensis]
MWRLLSSLTRGFRSVRPTHCCSQEGPDDKSGKQFDFQCQLLFTRRPCHTSQQTQQHDHRGNDGAKYFRHSSESSGKLETWKTLPTLQKKRGHGDWVFCNVDFKEKQSKWGRSCRWKSRERFLWTHSILQGFGWGSVVALTYSLYQGWDDLQREKEARKSIYKWYNERNKFPNDYQKENSWKNCEGSQPWNNSFVKNHIYQWWFQNGHQYPYITSVESDYQHRHLTVYPQELSKSLFSALWNLAVVQKDFNFALKRNVRDEGHQKNDHQSFDDGLLEDINGTKTLSPVDVVHKPNPEETESKLYTVEHTFDAQGSITECDASYKLENELPIEEPVKVFDIKEAGGKPYHEDSKVTQDNFSSDSGHSSGTNRPSVKQENKQDDNEDFDDDLKKILNAGIEDIRMLQGELKSAIAEDFARSSESSSPGSALVYFQVGTMLGDPNSTFNLALCHHFGRGVKQDMRKARNLYEAASRKGHGEATFNLAILVSQGQGGSADLSQARRLLSLAAERGVEEARLALQQIDEEEESEDDVYEGGLSRTQSEPTLSSVPSSNWSSSYSTTDLDILEDSLGFVSTEINARTRPVFHLT